MPGADERVAVCAPGPPLDHGRHRLVEGEVGGRLARRGRVDAHERRRPGAGRDDRDARAHAAGDDAVAVLVAPSRRAACSRTSARRPPRPRRGSACSARSAKTMPPSAWKRPLSPGSTRIGKRRSISAASSTSNGTPHAASASRFGLPVAEVERRRAGRAAPGRTRPRARARADRPPAPGAPSARRDTRAGRSASRRGSSRARDRPRTARRARRPARPARARAPSRGPSRRRRRSRPRRRGASSRRWSLAPPAASRWRAGRTAASARAGATRRRLRARSGGRASARPCPASAVRHGPRAVERAGGGVELGEQLGGRRLGNQVRSGVVHARPGDRPATPALEGSILRV